MGLVLDTSALVGLERSGVPTGEALGELASNRVVIPAVVFAELLVGVHLADSAGRAAGRRARIEALMSRCPLVEFDGPIAKRWAALFADLGRAGAMIPANDLAVAATALHLDYAVLIGPRGERHFGRVESLEIHVLG